MTQPHSPVGTPPPRRSPADPAFADPGLIDVTHALVSAVRRARDPRDEFAVADAILAIDASWLDRFFHADVEPAAIGDGPIVLAIGIGASPGAATGRLVVDPEDAIAAAARGEDVILVRPETLPEDVAGMRAARAVVTTRGGMASHAAVVARAWGTPAVVGASAVRVDAGGITIGDHALAVGSEISVDGRRGEVLLGRITTSRPAAPPELDQLLRWADELRRGRLTVRANADTAADVTIARAMGAEGVGLCRTEHMFLAPDRLPLVRRYILSDDEGAERDLLDALEAVQYEDFVAILDAAAGAPVTVRLLDAPLHEFLPDSQPLVARAARDEITPNELRDLVAIRRLQEANPMLGVRGFRLDVVRPGLYAMQVRALARAAATVTNRGTSVALEIMVPLLVGAAEMQLAEERIGEELRVSAAVPGVPAVRIGAMIETPRAALVATELAAHVDFVSFGTNDLTQLTFGFSRDDVEPRLIPAYLARGIVERNPFAVLDTEGVGRLLTSAITELRSVAPRVSLRACGEHAGDPHSIDFLVAAGLDSVSCSPFRIPGARLAVAQALLRQGSADRDSVTVAVRDGTDAVPMPTVWTALAEGTLARPGDEEFAVLHALALRAPLAIEVIAELALVDERAVREILASLLEAGLVRRGGDLWAHRPAGRERHGTLLTQHRPATLDMVRTLYLEFRPLDLRLKRVCTAWQLRDGEPNDHGDPDHDARCFDELDAIDAAIGALLDRFATHVPRLAAYRIRLTGASRRVLAGELHMFTAAMCGSYHDVWMELHQDLALLLGVDRGAETED